MITLYLTKIEESGIKFVYVFNDKGCSDFKCRFNSNTTSLPNKRRKEITINGMKYKVEWI